LSDERVSRRPLGVATLCGVLLMAVAPLLLSACESTQSKSERLAREGKGVSLAGKGLVIKEKSKDVEVVSTDVLQDRNGAAVVVVLRNTSKRTLAQVPVAIDVRGNDGKSLFRNDAPGLEPTLVKAPLIRSGQRLLWVNDQIDVARRPSKVEAEVGAATAGAPHNVPRIELTRPRLESDPVSGVAATGFAANRSKVEQRKLVLFAVARRGDRVVAAGRGQIPRLKPGKRARYQIFFIGNPRRGRVTVAAPPTRL
jgi:hypothetical protein